MRLVSYTYMPSPLPRQVRWSCSLVYLHRRRPSLCNSQVGSCNYFFGACSAFTHVTACTLAESLNDPFHRKLRQLRCLRCRFDCYRVERTSSRAGVAPAEVQRLSRRTVSPTIRVASHTSASSLCTRKDRIRLARATIVMPGQLLPIWKSVVGRGLEAVGLATRLDQ